jgi:hypothetical protein
MASSSVVVKYNDAAYYTGLLYSIESVGPIYRPRLTLYHHAMAFTVISPIRAPVSISWKVWIMEEILYVIVRSIIILYNHRRA